MVFCTQDYSDWCSLHHTHAPFGHQLAAARAVTHPDLRQVALRETWRGLSVEQPCHVASSATCSTAEYGGNVFTESLTSYDAPFWRVSHAVPPPTAQAIAETIMRSLDASRTGALLLSGHPVWVQPDQQEQAGESPTETTQGVA